MKRVIFLSIVGWIVTGVAVMVPQSAKAATTYSANVGAETQDQSVQADGFFPNELWLLQGDSIRWTFVPKNEIHTVTLLTQPPGGAEQVRPSPPPPAGPPFAVQMVNCTAAAALSYDGSVCASTQTGLAAPATFTVTFPTAGNYKLVCLVHTDMNGTVHVLSNTQANAALLHTQQFYNQQAQQEANAILLDNDLLQFTQSFNLPQDTVEAGIGKIVATGGGTQYGAVVRFLNGTIYIHSGQSVTWTNLDPTEPHTVTFGTEPAGFIPPVPAGLTAPAGDGTLTAAIACSPSPATSCDADYKPESNTSQVYNATTFVNSGFLQAQAPDRTAPASGDTQLPPGTTRITITFPKPGNYYYHCALHDVDGMVGEVVVLP